MRMIASVLAVSLVLTACGGDAPESVVPAAGDPAADAAAPGFAEQEAAVARNPLKDAYFGNLHVHTGWSF